MGTSWPLDKHSKSNRLADTTHQVLIIECYEATMGSSKGNLKPFLYSLNTTYFPTSQSYHGDEKLFAANVHYSIIVRGILNNFDFMYRLVVLLDPRV